MRRRSPRHRGTPVAAFLRRRRRLGLAASLALAVLLIALSVIDRSGGFIHDGGDLARYEGGSFAVLRVIDGDTIVLAVPDGKKKDTHVRLWGINAPEIDHPRFGRTGDPWGDEAAELARSLCDGKTVALQLEPSRVRDRYDRLLAFVRLPDGTWLNEHLLVRGMARADDRWPHRHLDRYALLEQQARRDRLGIWSDPAGERPATLKPTDDP